MSHLRLVTFNGWSGNRDWRGNLADLADDASMPEVIATQETYRWDGTIPGYDRHAVTEPGNKRAGNCVLFVRQRGVTICRERDIDVEGPGWVGPKHGIAQPPRDFPALSILTEEDEQRWDVVNVHRTWTGNLRRNMGSWSAEHRALIAFADRRHHAAPGRPLVMLGDWNGGKSDPRPLAVSGLAKAIGADVHLKRIDGALTRDCQVRVKRMAGGYGSDGHHPVIVTLTA